MLKWHCEPWPNRAFFRKRSLQKEDYEKFSNTLGYSELRKLEEMGISYHLPVPGVR